VWDAPRWREKEDDAFRSGRRRLAAGAVDGSGHLVAFTDIGVYVQQPSVAEQWNTIVDLNHRGHRLGFAAKVANLRNLRQEVPEALRLETWNAIENSRMIAINEHLGFQVAERVDEFQLQL
jgi:RimJ/RimL family protein N-acetyltransferase